MCTKIKSSKNLSKMSLEHCLLTKCLLQFMSYYSTFANNQSKTTYSLLSALVAKHIRLRKDDLILMFGKGSTMSFECEALGLEGRSSGSVFGQVNVSQRNRPMADFYYSSCNIIIISDLKLLFFFNHLNPNEASIKVGHVVRRKMSKRDFHTAKISFKPVYRYHYINVVFELY